MSSAWLPRGLDPRLFSESSRFRRLVADPARRTFLFQVVDRAIRSGGNIIVSFYIARVLGASLYGVLSFVITVVVTTSVLSSLSLSNVLLIRFASIAESDRRVWLSSVTALRLIGACLAVALSPLVAWLGRSSNGAQQWWCLLVSLSLLLQACDSYEQLYLATGKIANVMMARWTAFAISTLGKLLAVWVHAPFEIFLLLAAIDLGLYAAFYLVIGWRENLGPRWSLVERRIAISSLTESWPAAVAAIAVMLYMRFDQFALAHLRGQRELGLYVAGVTITDLWNFFGNALAVASAAPLTRLKADPSKDLEYESKLSRVLRWSFWAGVGFAATVCAFAPFLVRVLYGSEYAPAVQPLRVLVWSAPFVGLGLIGNLWLIQNRTLKFVLPQAVFTAIISVVGNVAFARAYGLMGCAFVALSAQIAASMGLNFVFPSTRKLGVLQLKAFQVWNLFK